MNAKDTMPAQRWYRVNEFNNIEPVSVTESTQHRVRIVRAGYSRWFNKRSLYGNYFQTWEEARQCALECIQGKIENLSTKLGAAETQRNKIRDMQEPV